MGFLVGNDFIPHLPHLHISHDALPLLYGTYITILPELGGKKILIFICGFVHLVSDNPKNVTQFIRLLYG
jgi:hypothetical protein